MSDQPRRQQSVRRKLNAIPVLFQDRSVLLINDSIVRGTTAQQIVAMAREAGAKQVYLASLAPQVRFPNVYGIDIPGRYALIAHGRNMEAIKQQLGVDGLIFQNLNDLLTAVRQENSSITQFEASLFTGEYITGDTDSHYLA